jgi:AhpD family alkylhydroperoxidase
MTRIPLVNPATATGPVRQTLDELSARRGELGPMVRGMANSSALLRGYLDLNRAMKRSHLDRRISERISLAVQEWLGCDYRVAAHSDAARAPGLSETDIELARNGTATDPRTAAVVAFGHQIAAAPAEITDDSVEALRTYGYRDEQIADVVGLVTLNVLTGAFKPRRGHRRHLGIAERRMNHAFNMWTAAIGAVGCGRCATPA